MDKATLVNRIREALTSYHTQVGTDIEYFNLTPTYGEAVSNLFTLSVSTPALTDVSCFVKTNQLMSYLYEHLTSDEVKQIAVLRFFDSKEELKRQVSASILGTICECERVLYVEPELVEV